jgi:hypothetical protein
MKKTKAKSPKTTKSSKPQPTLVVFLLDRSGSMASVLDETIGGFNGYLEKLQKDDDCTMRFTMSQFDSVGHDLMCKAVPMKEVNKLTRVSYVPRGGTPLYDAMGRGIAATEGASDKYKVLFVTLTDGQENASSEFTLDALRARIKQKEDQDNWTFAYIGMGIEGFHAAQHLSQGTNSASNVLHTNKANAHVAYAAFAGKTRDFSKSRRAGGAGGVSVSCMWDSEIK